MATGGEWSVRSLVGRFAVVTVVALLLAGCGDGTVADTTMNPVILGSKDLSVAGFTVLIEERAAAKGRGPCYRTEVPKGDDRVFSNRMRCFPPERMFRAPFLLSVRQPSARWYYLIHLHDLKKQDLRVVPHDGVQMAVEGDFALVASDVPISEIADDEFRCPVSSGLGPFVCKRR